MSTRLMSLPPELRLIIYEMVFEDNAPDKLELCADTTDQKPTGNEKQFRQIDLLTAKDHYPQAALLATCRQIYKEAEPVFEVAAKLFWDIDAFNIPMLFRDNNAGRQLEHRKFLTQVESMSLLRAHGIKSLRNPHAGVVYIIATDGKRGFSVTRQVLRTGLPRVFTPRHKQIFSRYESSYGSMIADFSAEFDRVLHVPSILNNFLDGHKLWTDVRAA